LIKAGGNFPAVYGIGQLTNIIAFAITELISQLQSLQVPQAPQMSWLNEEALERLFGTMGSLVPPNIVCGIFLFIHMVFAAAIFEEFICRGLMLSALKPYGNGVAIFITAFLFGIMHGNFQQFFYAFTVGIVLGYITVQTKSILAATVLHAMFNSLSAIMMLFITTDTVQEFLYKMFINNADVTPFEGNMMIMAWYGIFMAIFFGLIITGIVLAIKKLTRMRHYKTGIALASDCPPEILARTRWRLFFTSIPVIIMMILTVDRFAGGFAAGKISEFLWG
jgi:membrane protease YdiL (CAAX protease family)